MELIRICDFFQLLLSRLNSCLTAEKRIGVWNCNSNFRTLESDHLHIYGIFGHIANSFEKIKNKTNSWTRRHQDSIPHHSSAALSTPKSEKRRKVSNGHISPFRAQHQHPNITTLTNTRTDPPAWDKRSILPRIFFSATATRFHLTRRRTATCSWRARTRYPESTEVPTLRGVWDIGYAAWCVLQHVYPTHISRYVLRSCETYL